MYWYYLYTYCITYISSPTIICWWYLHLRVHQQQQPGDLALQEVNCVTVDLTLAGWRHGTKRGRGPRWLIVLLRSYLNLTVLIVSPPPCPSPARRLGTASLQEVDYVTVNLP